MKYDNKLIPAQFVKRYKRFFADVELNGRIEPSHVPNTGSLKGICDKSRPCLISPAQNPDRKLKFTLEQVCCDGSWVGVNTHKANELAFEAFQRKTLPHWHKFTDGTREVKINKETRLDLKLTDGKSVHFVEVKSVTMKHGAHAMFPDAETTRGQKHLEELMKLLAPGTTTEILFVVQRNDVDSFMPARDIDPEYARLLFEAQSKGVLINAFTVDLQSEYIELTSRKIPVIWGE